MSLRTMLFGFSSAALLVGACTIEDGSDDDDGGEGGESSETGGSSQGGKSPTGGAPASTGGAPSGTGGAQGGDDNAGGGAQPTGGKVTGGAPGSGGSTQAGAAGDAGSGGEPPEGGAGGGGPVSSDSCDGAEPSPNDDRESSTPYALGTAYGACLQAQEDVDFYEFTTPDDGRGGYVTVSITDVGATGDTAIELFTAEDNGSFRTNGTNTEGGSLFTYFTVKPATQLRLSVTNYVAVTSPNPYTLTAEYHQVPDVHEPNDSRPQAKSIDVGAAIEGYMHAGRSLSTAIPEAEWQDWFAVELEAGELEVLLSIVAADNDGDITLYDPLGTEIASQGSNTEGSSVRLEFVIEEAGKYFVRVNPYVPPNTDGNTNEIPQFLTMPYTLTVTQ